MTALDHMHERAQKEQILKPVIESDIEELSAKSADIMLTGEEELEPEESEDSDDSDTRYHKTNNKLPVPCSECSRKKRFAQALNCKQCSKCTKGDAAALPLIGSSDELDLENILNEAAEKNIMPDVEKNKQKELNLTETETESDKKVNSEKDITEKTEHAKKDIKVKEKETDMKLNVNGVEDKKTLQLKLTNIMPITKK